MICPNIRDSKIFHNSSRMLPPSSKVGNKKACIFWSLVLYSLAQIAINFILNLSQPDINLSQSSNGLQSGQYSSSVSSHVTSSSRIRDSCDSAGTNRMPAPFLQSVLPPDCAGRFTGDKFQVSENDHNDDDQNHHYCKQLHQHDQLQQNYLCPSTFKRSTNSLRDHRNYLQQQQKLHQHRHQQRPVSSPSTPTATLSPSTYLNVLLEKINVIESACGKVLNFFDHLLSGPRVLMAEAVATNLLYQINHSSKEIIVLNSTNFNTELIQSEHPFPHIKLIEYYLPYCGICLRFKQTYLQLAADIHTWRNVIRLSAIDLGVSSNSPIAHSWSVDVVPTLRIHPPPSATLAAKLDEQHTTLVAKLASSEIQKPMYEEYNAAKLMISSLSVTSYTADSKKETLSEKVATLKLDLLHYIENYVHAHPLELPATWPNLRPVTEQSLVELQKRHPRHELFLIIDATSTCQPNATQTSGSNASPRGPKLGLSIMMELSSTAAWKSVRYVCASSNKALIEDIVAQKKRESQVIDPQSNNNQPISSNREQIELQNLLSNKLSEDNTSTKFVLLHVDSSHWPSGQLNSTPPKFPSITVVAGLDLVNLELATKADRLGLDGGVVARAARSLIDHSSRSVREKREASNINDGELNFEAMSLPRKVELVTLYVNQTYTETKDDREFVEALKSFDEDPTSNSIKREISEKFNEVLSHTGNQVTRLNNDDKQNQVAKSDDTSSLFAKLNLFSRISQGNERATPDEGGALSSLDDNESYDGDYGDKLRAMRYIFFQEVPRKLASMDRANAPSSEKHDKLNTLVNLVAVIKAYFPLPDLASIQFIDGIQNYLSSQQQALTTVSNEAQDATQTARPLVRGYKYELKQLELLGMRLPELKRWRHCEKSGYPCALWRLFHTLTAFEYKKLSQIGQQNIDSQQQQQQQQQQPSPSAQQKQIVSKDVSSNNTNTEVNEALALSSKWVQPSGNDSLAPVERVVSPPSTTTSLSLTIATPTSSSSQHTSPNTNGNNNQRLTSEADLPVPVLLVMRDYVTNFFSCEECAKNFETETADLSYDRIRHRERAEFSIMWLWETHNRINKRLSVDSETNPPQHPKNWFPTYEQCPKCYKKPPSFLMDTNVEPTAIFHESIDWNYAEVLDFLVQEYTRQPMDNSNNIFGYQIPYMGNVLAIGLFFLLLIVLLRCASCYIERQRRHKASLLNGNGVHYSVELQAH